MVMKIFSGVNCLLSVLAILVIFSAAYRLFSLIWSQPDQALWVGR
jgi:hypothetical protein